MLFKRKRGWIIVLILLALLILVPVSCRQLQAYQLKSLLTRDSKARISLYTAAAFDGLTFDTAVTGEEEEIYMQLQGLPLADEEKAQIMRSVQQGCHLPVWELGEESSVSTEDVAAEIECMVFVEEVSGNSVHVQLATFGMGGVGFEGIYVYENGRFFLKEIRRPWYS